MTQYLPMIVAFLAAFAASGSRIFTATRAFWGRFPAWAQTLAPQIALALGALGTGIAGGIKSWTDLTVVFIGAFALLLPGLPSNRSAAPMQAGKPVVKEPSAGDQAVSAAIVKKASVPPPSDKTPPWGGPASSVAALLLAVCFAHYITACSLFGSHGSFWPVLEHCAPSPASLVSQVEDILLAGGDYEAALKAKALQDGAGIVECAVAAAVDLLSAKAGKVGASPETAPAAVRGKMFLAKVSAQ